LYGAYSIEELQKCVVYVKQMWLLSKSTQSYSRFDAVNTKYDAQTALNLRTLWPPTVVQSLIQSWIYTKEKKDPPAEAEPMDID